MLLTINRISGLAFIGVYDYERRRKQKLYVNLWVEFDAGASGTSDSLSDTLDYSTVEASVLHILSLRHYNLLESLMNEVGKAVLALPRVREVTVEIIKPGALLHNEGVSLKETYRP